ncbi:MAG TPA: hypothetical protein VGC72_16150 [Candidatus Elarobacter sp.]
MRVPALGKEVAACYATVMSGDDDASGPAPKFSPGARILAFSSFVMRVDVRVREILGAEQSAPIRLVLEADRALWYAGADPTDGAARVEMQPVHDDVRFTRHAEAGSPQGGVTSVRRDDGNVEFTAGAVAWLATFT